MAIENIEPGDTPSGEQLSSLVAPEKMIVSRKKMAMYFAGSLAFVVIGLLLPSNASRSDLSWGCAFFGLGAMVFAWMVVRPPSLVLNDRGFICAGGFLRTPKQVLWKDIDLFFVYQLGYSGEMVGYRYLPGKGPTSMGATILAHIGKKIGGHPSLPRGWPLSPKELVEKLNEYRSRAVGIPHGTASGRKPSTSS